MSFHPQMKPAPMHQQQQKQQQAAKTKKPSKGGAWRAFVRMRSGGHRGNADFKQLGIEFRALKENGSEAMDTLNMLAKRMKIVASAGKQGSGKRFVRMNPLQLRGDLVAKFASKCANMSMSEKALAIIQQVEYSESATARAVTWARSLEKQKRHEHNQTYLTAVQKLQDFQSHVGKSHLQDMCKHQNKVVDSALKAVHLAYQHSHSSNLGTSLSQFWADWHEEVQEAMLQQDIDTKVPLCCSQGFCLCSVEGKMVKKMRDNLHLYLKRELNKSGVLKIMMRDGNVVLQLGSAASMQAFGSSIATSIAASSSSSSSSNEIVPGSRIYLHIAVMYFSPWRPTYHVLREVAALDAHAVQVEDSSIRKSLFPRNSSLPPNLKEI
eukprot:2934459-Amphidinium_carterae.6